MTELYKGFTIEIDYDPMGYADDPTDDGNFNIIQTGRLLDEEDELPAEMVERLEQGQAFWIDKYEHSGVIFSLAGESYDRWDTSSNWGVIDLDDNYVKGMGLNERREVATQDLKMYTQWANGEAYCFSIIDPNGEELDGYGGIFEEPDEIMGWARTQIDRITNFAKYAKSAHDLHN